MKSFSTEAAALAAAQLTTPAVVKYPALVPYLQAQLEYLDMV
jgi:hypothetical protein